MESKGAFMLTELPSRVTLNIMDLFLILHVDNQKSRRSTACPMAKRMDSVMCGRGALILNDFARAARLMKTLSFTELKHVSYKTFSTTLICTL